ncbi:MAG: hypothetical protein PHV98_00800 [Candidatus Omnitrophica bacterium]|nr:hypothetical protein [Candidatus Omnitrophota bacterium]
MNDLRERLIKLLIEIKSKSIIGTNASTEHRSTATPPFIHNGGMI